ncbi:MAG: hypothetical protein E7016_07065 [Alphaproteobacteria bacterium]|nr:hypothetical protein [Alphaproteobacteria bacterium]
MQSENEYIGDEKFKNFLNHYECPTSLEVVKLKFAGAICSPNLNLRPTDVISSFWEQNKQPRLETKKEAELFFKFFMGLWDNVFEKIRRNKLTLSKAPKDNIKWGQIRYEELEYGFLEGFWGGCDDLKVPNYVAQIVDSLSEMADAYAMLSKKAAMAKEQHAISNALLNTDKTVEKAFSFIIENSVLPRIADLERTVN